MEIPETCGRCAHARHLSTQETAIHCDRLDIVRGSDSRPPVGCPLRPQPDPEKINPGVRRLVSYLRARDFATCDSGDGVTHEHECDRDHAYVAIRVAPERLVTEADRLVRVLREVGVEVLPMSPEDTPCIQASYDPADGTALLDLTHVTDAMVREWRATRG